MHDLPDHYRATIRSLLRFALVMTIVGLLSGVLFQESAKKLDLETLSPGLHLAAGRRLALVHGHVLVSAVLIPIAMAVALVLARAVGGRQLSGRPLSWLLRGYLPGVSAMLALMLIKAYHLLLSVRGGTHDLAQIDEAFSFGAPLMRHVVYGGVHVAMAAGLGVFVVALWRSLKDTDASAG
jgi:hypothetical protein